MLRVTIDYIPLGDESRKETLGSIEIINDMTSKNRPEFGNYRIKYGEQRIRIQNYPRKNGFLRLVSKSISKLLELKK